LKLGENLPTLFAGSMRILPPKILIFARILKFTHISKTKMPCPPKNPTQKETKVAPKKRDLIALLQILGSMHSGSFFPNFENIRKVLLCFFLPD